MPKTVILTHADCDGICSGAVALSRFPEATVFFTKPASLLDDLRHTEAEKIIISDIALTKKDAVKIIEEMKRKECEIFYFDHHDIPDSIKEEDVRNAVSAYFHEKGTSASELIYRAYKNEIPRERVWLAIYGAIGDYLDNTPFIRERMLNWDRRALYFEVSTITLGIKTDEFSGYDAKRIIVYTLASGKNPSDVPGLVKSAKEAVNKEFELYELVKKNAKVLGNIAYVKDIHTFGFRGPSALFSATVKNKPIGISVHTREKYLDITIRTRNYSLKLNKLAEIAAECVDGSGGGLEAAAGARIPHGTLEIFLERLNEEIEKSG